MTYTEIQSLIPPETEYRHNQINSKENTLVYYILTRKEKRECRQKRVLSEKEHQDVLILSASHALVRRNALCIPTVECQTVSYRITISTTNGTILTLASVLLKSGSAEDD